MGRKIPEGLLKEQKLYLTELNLIPLTQVNFDVFFFPPYIVPNHPLEEERTETGASAFLRGKIILFPVQISQFNIAAFATTLQKLHTRANISILPSDSKVRGDDLTR